ncbi:MAG: hypothetical protein AAB431_00665 [Patescibacteria group bacterium]
MRLSIIISFLLLALIPHSVRAISLAPAVLEMTATRGSVVQQTISVINTKGTEQTYFVGIMKFKPSVEGESPVFISPQEDQTELPQWIRLPFTEFRVAANTKAEVPFEVAVPLDVKSGGYYAALTVSQAPGEVVADNGAIIEAKVAVLLLLTVEGETEEKLALLDFHSDKSDLTSQLGGVFTYRLQNQGNVHVTPKGTLKLTDLFGRTLIESDANPELGRVLPGSTRAYELGIETQKDFFWIVKDQIGFFAIGPIKATLDLSYGEEGQQIYSSFSFWHFPWQLLVTIGVPLIVLLGLFHLKKPR